MFEGTRWFYKVLYFITAMSPAYIIFLLQTYDKYFNNSTKYNNIFYISLLLFIILLVLLGMILKQILLYQYKYGTNEKVLSNEKRFDKILLKNGSVLSFLLGNILPSVVILENDIVICIVLFILLQILIYKLIVKSNDLFPNVVLILLKVDILVTKSGEYVFVFNGKKQCNKGIYHIGTPHISKMYITVKTKR
ncbi:hypothetical protein [Staphylococcus simulans]|uniref:Uncharacterized protein n=1 Tax=Staphylococcus simulans UMC-CNS-990 TaxID=1405498 RepID=A0ABN0PG13_STASI|nr:hypothetical protein [Staphylococcus simulans]ERS94587.1 hypothetical protein SSIM_00405 [Staphylococcus simulans UMC-CNS-990]MCE5147996.1 antibiotic resistance protein VanZ [Staphylococcus simulans]